MWSATKQPSEPLLERLQQALQVRAQAGNLRSLTLGRGLHDFTSNDYLGLACSKELHALTLQTHHKQQEVVLNGSAGSRLLAGHTRSAEALEAQLAALFKAESCLVFGSGYQANTALLSALPQKGDTILYDELIHASLKEGARLSFARRFSFKHNNMQDLAQKLSRATGKVFVVAESVYSMDGDTAPLAELTQLVSQSGAYLLLDEAHSTGIWGQGGSGLAIAQGYEQHIFARVYTFGKAMGVHGACIAGSKLLTDYLVNFARPFIYTTAPSPYSLAAISSAFAYLASQPQLQHKIHENIAYFRAQLSLAENSFLQKGYINSVSPIQVFRIPGNSRVRQVAVALQSAGLDVRAILSPTVKEGEERLRICLHVFNTTEHIAKLLQVLRECLQQEFSLSS
jgi:8-amino-7-oxononanoate synthase